MNTLDTPFKFNNLTNLLIYRINRLGERKAIDSSIENLSDCLRRKHCCENGVFHPMFVSRWKNRFSIIPRPKSNNEQIPFSRFDLGERKPSSFDTR